jgi:hypothetical protein
MASGSTGGAAATVCGRAPRSGASNTHRPVRPSTRNSGIVRGYGVRRVLPLVMLLLATGAGLPVVGASPAGACSCLPVAQAHFDNADAALIGTFVEQPTLVPPNLGQLDELVRVRLRVQQVVKGDLPAELTVVAPWNGASCGIEAADGSPTGLLLKARTADTWESSLCSQLAPEDLLAFSGGDTNPPTPGDEPVSPEEDGGNSNGFAIALYVVYLVAAIGVVYVLVRYRSRSDGSAPDAA